MDLPYQWSRILGPVHNFCSEYVDIRGRTAIFNLKNSCPTSGQGCLGTPLMPGVKARRLLLLAVDIWGQNPRSLNLKTSIWVPTPSRYFSRIDIVGVLMRLKFVVNSFFSSLFVVKWELSMSFFVHHIRIFLLMGIVIVTKYSEVWLPLIGIALFVVLCLVSVSYQVLLLLVFILTKIQS